MKNPKTVYDLKMHETLEIIEEFPSKDAFKKYEVTRVPGGWVYSFEFPGWRQTQSVFVPFSFPDGDTKKKDLKNF